MQFEVLRSDCFQFPGIAFRRLAIVFHETDNKCARFYSKLTIFQISLVISVIWAWSEQRILYQIFLMTRLWARIFRKPPAASKLSSGSQILMQISASRERPKFTGNFYPTYWIFSSKLTFEFRFLYKRLFFFFYRKDRKHFNELCGVFFFLFLYAAAATCASLCPAFAPFHGHDFQELPVPHAARKTTRERDKILIFLEATQWPPSFVAFYHEIKHKLGARNSRNILTIE